ncbi:MAG TPA: aminotransferase class III-fold pyridoxal phosphate-dependent enzyme [Polyangia bacterium]|nr:aminotransferase class III-fold pyridoxal phosphate-dependent enzyme [Polyangia bacterium]
MSALGTPADEITAVDGSNDQDRPLAEQGIRIIDGPPGPRARERIAHDKQFVSPSLIFCYPLYVARAAGCMVEDIDGNVYLDAQAGVATASTGHCHPKVAAAIAAQAQNLIHICGTDFHYPAYGAVCERLNALAQRLSPAGSPATTWQTFLTNSGTEAVEAALKLSRNHTERGGIVAFRGGFHGRTYGSLSLTSSKTKYRKHFGPLLPSVFHGTWGSVASVEDELFVNLVAPEDVAAIVVEPVLGEGGYILPPPDFLPGLRRLCDAHGILLVFDEVQSGMGRTGKMFAAEHFGVTPDVVILAKGLASGMPLGAMMARQELMTWPPGSHGSTCAGNPVCCAAALATLDLLETSLVDNAARRGEQLLGRLARELDLETGVVEVRGAGLMIGVEFDNPARADAVADLCFRRGLLVLECGTKAIRISPPLILTEAQANTIADVFVTACHDVWKGHVPPSP